MKKKVYCLLILLLILKNISVHGYAQSFSFVHITDVHASDGTGNIGNYDDQGVMFHCMMQMCNLLDPRPDFVVVSGDISNIGSKSPDGMYNAITRHLFPAGGLSFPGNGDFFIDSAQTIPIYFVSGNHEYYESLLLGLDQADAPEYYPEFLAPDEDYSVVFNNAILLFIRTGYDIPFYQDPSLAAINGSGIADAQCQWMRSTLASADSAGIMRKIIVTHHPIVNISGTNYDGTPNSEVYAGLDDGSFKTNRENFMNICDSNGVDLVLSGHVHQNVVTNRAGEHIDEDWPYGTRYVQTAKAFRGAYRIITVDSNFVSVGTPMVVDCNSLGIHSGKNVSCEVIPNPFTNNAVLSFSTNEPIQNLEVKLYDVLGREAKVFSNIHENQINIDRGNLVAGIYFYKLTSTDGRSGSGKLVITD